MAEAVRATLRDVAKASGVSRATVSFVLNNTPNQTISPATRERVQRAARELGYVPHGIARALREGASRAVVLEMETGLEGNYSRSYIRGLDEELAAHEHVLFVRHGHSAPESARQVLDAIAPRAVLRFGEAYRTGHELADRGGGWRDGLAAHAALQIGYLAEKGHTTVALALPENDPPLRQVRVQFSRRAAKTHGLAVKTCTVPHSRAAATKAVRALLARAGEVTAIAGYDDDVALRVLAACGDLGVEVPASVAVIGFDDTEHGELTTPALTTVRIDAEAHGRLAARDALGLDAGDLEPAPARVIVRESA